MKTDDIIARIDALERQLRVWRTAALLGLGACFAVVVGFGSLATARSAAPDDIIRTHGLIITDAHGVERIRLGAPVPDAPGETGHRISPATGLILMDANGRERMGFGLLDNGMLDLGFDAAPGAGHGPNRERLHLGVDPDGKAFLRFLDSDSGLAGRLVMNDEDALELQFVKAKDKDHIARSVVDMAGWRRLPDYELKPSDH